MDQNSPLTDIHLEKQLIEECTRNIIRNIDRQAARMDFRDRQKHRLIKARLFLTA